MSESATPAFDAELLDLYQECFRMFVKAHLSVAKFGGQLVFDVAPGGVQVTVNTRQNLGKCTVGGGPKNK